MSGTAPDCSHGRTRALVFSALIGRFRDGCRHHSSKTKLALYCISSFWLLSTNTAFSQTLIEEQQRLNFGTLAIASNASVSRFTFPRTGSNLAIEGQIVLIASGLTGRYRFTGFPANTPLGITLDNTTLIAQGGGVSEALTVDNYDNNDLTTDANGEAELLLGARLSTTGTGNGYADTLYSGTTVLRVNYWQPDVSAFVTNSQSIDLQVELRSTLTIDQEQALHFGTLFARSSNTGQAVLSLSPTGSYSISEPDDTRLVSLVRPDQGVLRVSGAAPNYSLTITAQGTDVLLEHTENPAAAPHFILSALVTSPVAVGTTDAGGELVIQIGGTLKTELTTLPTVYPSGQYEGTYQLTVSY